MTAAAPAPAQHGAVSCRYCGVACPGPGEQRPTFSIGGGRTPSDDFGTSVCGECLSLRPTEPGVVLRAAARLVGVEEGDPHFEAALHETPAPPRPARRRTPAR